MPLRLIDPKQAIPWEHPDGRGTPDAVTFHIVPLTEGQSRKLRIAYPQTVTPNGIVMRQDEVLRDLFLSNVARIDNVLWPGTETPATIESRTDRERFFECVPAQYMSPVYVAIQNTGALDEGTRKN